MRIAIVGATGLVGRKIIETLYKRNHLSAANLILYASEKARASGLKSATAFTWCAGLTRRA